MQQARFVFATLVVAGSLAGDAVEPTVMWMLMSPNNRPLGQSAKYHATYLSCQESVRHLQVSHRRLEATCAASETNGQWAWRAELDDRVVAVASRAYLRMRECTYNLERFLAGIPEAAIVDGARSIRGTHDPADNTPVRSASLRIALRPR